jgi:hypothetical protein
MGKKAGMKATRLVPLKPSTETSTMLPPWFAVELVSGVVKLLEGL